MASSFDPEQRRSLGAYTASQVADYLRVAPATIRAWAVGQPYKTRAGKRAFFHPVIDVVRRPDDRFALSFVNLVELHVLSALRRTHDIPLRKVRKSLEYLQRRSGGEKHPLANRDLLTDGLDIWLEELGSFVSLSGEGQIGIRECLEAHLKRVERDAVTGRALRLFPFVRDARPVPSADEPRTILIDPEIQFGQPVLAGTGIPTRIVAGRFGAGESIEALAGDYDRTRQEIEEAIRWERRRRAA